MAQLPWNKGSQLAGMPECSDHTGYFKRLLGKIRIEQSTKSFLSSARRTPGFGLVDTLHGYLYARWPYFWIGLGTGEHRWVKLFNTWVNIVFNLLMQFPADKPQVDAGGLHLAKKPGILPTRSASFADTYHGKVLRLDAARQLVSLNKSVHLNNLETVIPYSLARDIILDNPDRILALDCPCRVVRSSPCKPLDVCLVLGEPFISFVAEHHSQKSRLIDRSEAVEILHEEAERGHIQHAFFKEAAFGRFFALCNCCSCCCGAMQAWRNGVPMLASSGYVSAVDEAACIGCSACKEHCQFNAVSIAEGSARVDRQACMGCGVCASFCPEKAISLKRDHTRSDPLELDQILIFGDMNR